jgi:hypothetical protein
MSQGASGINAQNAGAMNIDQIQETGLNVMYNVASIITLPVEMLMRPWFGTRYFEPPIFFLAAILMIVIESFIGFVGAVSHMVPGLQVPAPAGMLDFSVVVRVFFIASAIHSIRIFRRMIYPETEELSTFEVPPLPIFLIIPKGSNFWICRIIIEPLSIFFLSGLLQKTLIIQSPVALFLQISALMLSMKQYIGWFRSWQYQRNLLDMAFLGPIVGKMVNDTATQDDAARVHVASLPPDIRKATAARMARADSTPQTNHESPKPEAGFADLKFILRVLIIAAIICLGMVWLTGYRQYLKTVTRNAEMKRSPFGKKTANASTGSNNAALAPPTVPPPSFTRLAGYWQARGVIARRGVCFLRLEIRPVPENQFAAYSSLACAPMVDRIPMYSPMGQVVQAAASAILIGKVDGESIRFKMDKTIDPAARGCAMSALAVTPFGARQLTVEWQDACHGGQMVLQRVNQ